MRNAITAIGAAAVGLLAAGVLGVAGADTTPAPVPTSAPRTVSVEGVAGVPVAADASAQDANAAYRQGMAAAIADGQDKARFLAEKTGATLGVVQSVGEGGGYIQCPGEEEYTGVQPDFGSGSPIIEARSVAAVKGPAPLPRRSKPKHRKRHTAKRSAAQTCTLSTQVALVYQLS
jgi:uncharacterized protein YggE